MESGARAREIRVGTVISETFSIYGENLGALLGSAIVVFVVVGLAAGLLENTGGLVLGVLAAIVRLAGNALYTGFVVRLVEDVRDGRRDHSVGDLFSSAAPAIGPLILFGILYAIGVGIGLILLIIPGLILATFWSVGAPAIVVEDVGPLEALGRSWRLVRGQAWSVFATLLVVLIIVIAIGVVLGAIATPIGDAATLVASIISSAITAPIFSLAVSVMFFDLGGGRAAGVPATATESPPPAAPAT
jgi:predicted membrane protein